MIDQERQYRDYYKNVERTAEQRRKDLVKAFDEIAELQRINRNLLKIVGTSIGATSVLTIALLKLVEYFTQ